jgi:uncharacterized protein (DUF2235 family)|tara:strand:- start:768 stop:998 length:231 start_codon:yes stop_codon:yes gene_type:complete
MDTIYYIATLMVCFNGECNNFSSTPYSNDTGIVNCTHMLERVFKTQVGPYYDNIINFDVDKPEDIKIIYSSCDVSK